MPRCLWWAAAFAVARSALAAASCDEQDLAADDSTAAVCVALLQGRLERLAAAPEASGGSAAAAPAEGPTVPEEAPAAPGQKVPEALERNAATEVPSPRTGDQLEGAVNNEPPQMLHGNVPQVVVETDGGPLTVLLALALGMLALGAASLVPPAARMFHQQITLWVFGGSEEEVEAAKQGDATSSCEGGGGGAPCGAAQPAAAPPPSLAVPQATLPDEPQLTAPDEGTVAAVLQHATLEDKPGVEKGPERSRSHRQLDLLGNWHTASERKVFDLRLSCSIGVVCFMAIAIQEADTFSAFWHTAALQPSARLLVRSLSDNVWHVMLLFLLAGYYDASHYKHFGFRDLVMLLGLVVIPFMQFVAELLPIYFAGQGTWYGFNHPLRWMLQMFLLARVHVAACRWLGLSILAQLVLSVPYRALVCYGVARLQNLETSSAITYLIEHMAVIQGRALTTGMAIMTYTLAFGLAPLVSQTVARLGPRTTKSERLVGALLWAALLVLNVLGTDTGLVPSAEGAYVSVTYPPVWLGNLDMKDDQSIAGGITVFVAIVPLGLPLVLLQALLFVAAFAFLPPFVPRVAANSLIAASLCIGVCVAPLPLQMLQYFTTDRSAPEQVVAIVLWLAFFLCLFYPLSQWIFMSLMRGAGTLAGHALRQWRGGRGLPHTPPGRSPLASEQNSCHVSREPSSLSREHSRLSRQLL